MTLPPILLSAQPAHLGRWRLLVLMGGTWCAVAFPVSGRLTQRTDRDLSHYGEKGEAAVVLDVQEGRITQRNALAADAVVGA